MAVDIGYEALDHDNDYASRTFICTEKVATVAGLVTSADVWAYANISGAIVATFFRPDAGGNPNHFTARDAEAIGAVATGAKRTFSGLSINVEIGDYIGIYFSGGSIQFGSGAGVWFLAGDQTECENVEFDDELVGDWVVSAGGYITGAVTYQPRPAGMAVGTTLVF